VFTRQPGGQIDGDCWLNNQPWRRFGALRALAESWPARPAVQVRRQFIICRPTDRRAPEGRGGAAKTARGTGTAGAEEVVQFWK